MRRNAAAAIEAVAQDLDRALRALGDKKTADHLRRFFKTGPGEYAEGDVFYGVTVPQTRKVARQFHGMELSEVVKALRMRHHETRLAALFILRWRYENGGEMERKAIYTQYLRNTAFVNNWDLVDASACYIVGPYLETRPRTVLSKLARSKSLWERRIGILATFHFIRLHDFNDILRLVEIVMRDKEDLIHKAAGWMLREVGKRDSQVHEAFVLQHLSSMPRTMLRYAIEKLPEARRLALLKGNNASRSVQC